MKEQHIRERLQALYTAKRRLEKIAESNSRKDYFRGEASGVRDAYQILFGSDDLVDINLNL